MDAEWMRAALLMIDHTMEQPGHRSDARAHAPDSDVITVPLSAQTTSKTITSRRCG